MKLSFFDKGGSRAKTSDAVETTKEKPKETVEQPKPSSGFEYQGQDKEQDFSSDYLNLKVELHQKVIDRINLSALENLERSQIDEQITALITELLAEEERPLNRSERKRLCSEIVDELIGFGPLEPLLSDPSVSDILVNSSNEVFVERHGMLQETPVRFKDDQHLLRIIDRIVVGVGRRIDEANPLVDARLPDGSRVNAVIPPITLDGPSISIRKFAKIPFDMEKLVEIGSMTRSCADVLAGVVKCRLNILVAGGTGTGKTTMLNAMSRFIGDTERIVTIEDAAELQLQQRHVVRMETRPQNIEGKGEVNQRHLVKNALRMRPDRIILGEIRGGEAFDMLQAMNTGHDGSITTVHANTPRDALSRVEQMIGMSGMDLPAKSVRGQIASALDVIVQIKRFADGSRRVVSVSEINGMEGDVVTMQEIFRYKQSHIDQAGKVHGTFTYTGLRPRFFDIFQANGLDTPTDMSV